MQAAKKKMTQAQKTSASEKTSGVPSDTRTASADWTGSASGKAISSPDHLPVAEGAVDPLYLKVARTLIAKIEDGEYAVGDLLPPETEVAQALGVSRQTVRQALAELREMGLISARRG